MAQSQRPTDVHQDKLCPPNKRYDLMDANKKVDLENLLKEITLTLDDFRTIFHLPQATEKNHDHFVPALKFSNMVPFYINNLGFNLELRSTSNFKTTGLLQPSCRSYIVLSTISMLIMQKIADISQLVNVIEEEEELAEDDYKLKRREKGKHVEEIRHTPSPRIRSTLVSSKTKKLQELTKIDPTPSSSTPSSSSPKIKLSNTNRLLYLFKSKPRSFR
ncbi:hypothetical protein Tco_0969231 [Tanacetum coccineum]